MAGRETGLDAHQDLVPLFATRAEIAELREKVMSLQTLVRALAVKLGADPASLEEWALCMGQFNSAPGRALSTAQNAAVSFVQPGSGTAPQPIAPLRPNDAF
ncbi:MAG: hypothetical protein JNM29_20405 [Candidatus Odyssella sp.]|nr:hypothetical protein [Candidatus Odyssella sp.]